MTGGRRHDARLWPRFRGRLVLAFLLVLFTPSAFAQRFLQPFFPSSALENPQALGMTPEQLPPDLDEPEIGEDASNLPGADTREIERKEVEDKAPPRRFHAGQSHEPAPPLPLVARLRRVLRQSPLGGNPDLWFSHRRIRDVYFVSFESGLRDRYFSFGGKHAVKGDFSSGGWRFLSTLGVKVAAWAPSLNARISYIDLMRMMPGYEARIGRLTIGGYVGLGYARSHMSTTQAAARSGRYGISALGEFWYDWGEAGPRLARFTSGYAMLETANGAAAMGLRHGARAPLLPVFIGPEASWSAGRNIRMSGTTLQSAFRKGRIGGHISEIPVMATRLRISAGAEWMNHRKPGHYIELAAHIAY